MVTLLRLSPYPLLVFLAAVVAQVVNFRLGPQPWTGDALFIASWAWTAHFLFSVFITACAALFAGQMLWDRGASLWATPAYRSSFVRRSWLLMTAAGTIPTLVAQIIALFSVRYASTDAVASVVLVNLAGIASVALLVILGFAVGIRWGRTVGTVLGFTVALVLQLLSYVSNLPVLMLGGATAPLVGLRIGTFFIILLVVTLVLGVVAAAMYVFRWAPWRGDWRRLSLGAVVSAVLVGVVLPAAVQPAPYEPASDPLDGLGCVDFTSDSAINGGEGVTGTVCTLAAHQQVTEHVAAEWMTLQHEVHQAGITAFPPGLVETTSGLRYEDLSGLEPGRDAMFSLGPDEMVDPDGTITQDWIVQRALYPYWCEALWADEAPPENLFAVEEQAQATFHAAITEQDPTKRAELAHEFDQLMAQLRQCGGS